MAARQTLIVDAPPSSTQADQRKPTPATRKGERAQRALMLTGSLSSCEKITHFDGETSAAVVNSVRERLTRRPAGLEPSERADSLREVTGDRRSCNDRRA